MREGDGPERPGHGLGLTFAFLVRRTAQALPAVAEVEREEVDPLLGSAIFLPHFTSGTWASPHWHQVEESSREVALYESSEKLPLLI